MRLVFPEVTGALCAKMDRGLSGQDAVNGMVCVFRIIQGGVLRQRLTQAITRVRERETERSVSSWLWKTESRPASTSFAV